MEINVSGLNFGYVGYVGRAELNIAREGANACMHTGVSFILKFLRANRAARAAAISALSLSSTSDASPFHLVALKFGNNTLNRL